MNEGGSLAGKDSSEPSVTTSFLESEGPGLSMSVSLRTKSCRTAALAAFARLSGSLAMVISCADKTRGESKGSGALSLPACILQKRFNLAG
jgi:hypothetical protein